MTAKLTGIYLYPIKSLGGISVPEASLTMKGLAHDRRWMLVDANGIFVTQRTHPQLALLQASLHLDHLRVHRKDDAQQAIQIPFQPESKHLLHVTIWEDQVPALEVSKAISRWFSEQVSEEVKLVFMEENAPRPLKAKYAVAGEHVSFADGMPYMIIGEASLADLNDRLDQPVGMDRFRPNFTFSSEQPFIEDSWQELFIGEAHFKVTKPVPAVF
ncbi:MOSC domain-containing protein [Nitritalea halalkaliphila LW7]|uniref:MOSC domain-containing protein n=1 Tax=Nitritalea halalkaliphila LW7 TaxID=1189621 RepID=I5BXP5_9BACT|nr:MOSC domain-containing protein [Nitritalea halalkaliphila LW7]